MDNTKKIRRALALYPFYEAASGDYLFFSVIQTLFLTLARGFSAEEVATVILIADGLDLALEYPSYRLIRRWGNSRSVLVGGLLPVFGIALVTFSEALPLIALGLACPGIATNFQSMSGAAARNNLMLLGAKEDFAKLFARGSMIYSTVSMAASVLAPFLFSFHRYAPSLLCAVLCVMTAAVAFLMPDYTEKGWAQPLTAEQAKKKERKKREELGNRNVKIGRGLRLLVIVFCMFFCAGTVFRSNTELLLSDYLRALFTEQKTIYIYGAILWGVRIVQLGVNAMMKRILDALRETVVTVASSVLLIACLSIGCSGLAFGKTMIPLVLTGISYIMVRGVVWDPLRTFLRTIAADTNNKKRQQKMMMMLSVGQSGGGILMDLLVVGTLRLFSLEHVFLVCAVVAAAEMLFAVGLYQELRRQTELLRYHDVLDSGGVDRVSERVFDCLCGVGFEKKDALSYRILLEEKLLGRMDKGAENEPVEVVLTARLDDVCVRLAVGGEAIDIFRMPEDGDRFANAIFSNVLRNL